MRSARLSNRPVTAFISNKSAGSIEDSGCDATVTSILDSASDSRTETASISAVISGDASGKLLPLCQATGTE